MMLRGRDLLWVCFILLRENTLTQSKLLEESVYHLLTSRSKSITEGSQGRSSEQEPRGRI